jgi:hypothetical protein
MSYFSRKLSQIADEDRNLDNKALHKKYSYIACFFSIVPVIIFIVYYVLENYKYDSYLCKTSDIRVETTYCCKNIGDFDICGTCPVVIWTFDVESIWKINSSYVCPPNYDYCVEKYSAELSRYNMSSALSKSCFVKGSEFFLEKPSINDRRVVGEIILTSLVFLGSLLVFALCVDVATEKYFRKLHPKVREVSVGSGRRIHPNDIESHDDIRLSVD